MSEESIPKSWVRSTIGEIYEVVGGGTPSTKNKEYWKGNIPWISSADIHGVRDVNISRYITETAVEKSATNKVPSETLLVVTRVGLGKIAFADRDICFSQDVQGLIAPPDLVYPKFALYFLSDRLQTLKYEGRGTTISGITKKYLKDTNFPIPPIDEQVRIVNKIEELFSELNNGIESLVAVREQLKVYRQAVLKHAFEGKLTAEWRARTVSEGFPSKIHEKVLSSAETLVLPEIPENWKYVKLASLGDLGRGKSKHRPRNDPKLFGGPYPFIQTGEVKAANRVVKEYSQSYSEFGLKQSKLWPEGTLCITIAANIAETAFIGFDGCFPDSVVGFTADKELVFPEYIELFIKSVRARIEAYAPATAQKNINLTTLENLVIPICPLTEQQHLISEVDKRLSVIFQNEEDIEQELNRAEILRQSILKSAFSGKLVEQDPNDEPASELLKRIKAEKEESKKGKKVKKGKAA